MTTPLKRDFLSFGDALFLYLERPGTPLHIASVSVFDGDIELRQLTRHIQSKLPQIPRYLQRVVIPPLGMGPPSWELTPNFNITNHVRELTLKRGTEGELKTTASAILSPLMDRNNPLWDVTIVHGLKHGRSALIFRLHHCLADGISGIGLLNTLLATTPEVPKLPSRRPRVPIAAPEAAGSRLLETAMQTWFSGIERILTASDEVLQLAQRFALGTSGGVGLAANGAGNGQGLPSSEELAQMLTELITMPDRLPFNLVCRGPQRFEWTSAPFADLRAIKAVTGATINDIVLSVLTAAFRRYSEMRGVKVKGRTLRIIVPVSVRASHRSNELGNHITFTPVTTPLGITDPKRLLDAVHSRAQFGKSSHLAEVVAFAGTVLGTIPSPLQAAIAPILSELPISVCNTICTNVPGPKVPLYVLGHEMLKAYPYVPIGGEMGINVAVLSYNGTAFFGFTGDVHAAPKLEMLARFVDQSIAELRRATGIQARASAKSRARRRPTSVETPLAAQVTEAPIAEVASKGATVVPLKATAATAA